MNIIEEYQQGKRDFSNAHLQDANLQGAYLQDAHLQYANLQYAHLQYANLQYAHLQYANLQDAHLQGAHLQYAHLQGAYLQDAHLQGAHLQYANLQGAHLQDAHLRGANLQDANLQYANLQYANLQDAHLQGANFLTSSHDIISEILRSRAENTHQRMLAGLVIVSRDWCWEEFAREISTAYPDLWEWSLSVLSEWECMRKKINAARILASRYRTDPIEAGKE